MELTLNGGGSTSSSPRSLLDELDDDTSAYLSESDIANWAKDRVKKDNHNQSELASSLSLCIYLISSQGECRNRCIDLTRREIGRASCRERVSNCV